MENTGLRRRVGAVVCAAFALFAVDSLTGAPAGAVCTGWPPDPAQPPSELADNSCFPTEWSITDPGKWWNYVSFVPPQSTSVRPEEIAMGSGLHADRAWALTTGDPRVLIAIIDSGMNWDNGNLRKRAYLNIGELPLPAGSACGAPPSPLDRTDPAVIACWDVFPAGGDGRVNVEDYEGDPAVSDQNGNGVIDGQDLILLFSDGVDDDGNGWTDDISGWDAYENDNDPEDDTDYGHGTGRAEEAASSPNDGGDIGVCPDCTVMLVRVGESFLCESNDFADAVVFAVDTGASVIGEALGCYNNTTYAMRAMEYAYLSGVYIVASMADETALHHNFPGANNHGFGVHSIRYDDPNGLFPVITTFVNFENCTNFGGQLAMSAPSTACSSGSTGMTSGLVGLVYSAALENDIPAPALWNPATDLFGARRLTADEVKGLVTLNADDIDIPEGLAVPCTDDLDCDGAASERCLHVTGGNVCSAECSTSDPAGCGDPDNFECRLLTLDDTRNCFPDGDDPAGLPACTFSGDCAVGERCRDVGGARVCVIACDDGATSCAAGFTCTRGAAALAQCYPTKFPSYPGWDQHFGYGRVNARRSIDPLYAPAPRIPPEVDIDAPRWFAYLDPAITPDLDIVGRITFREALYTSVDYVVEWAPGIQPGDGDWVEITSDTGVANDLVGTDVFTSTVLATFDLTAVDAIQSVTGTVRDPNDFTVTIRIRVLANPIGGGTPVPGEMRKVISVHTDPDLVAGFPLYLGPSGEASPKVLDLDGDGRDDIVLADADGIVHVFRYDAGALTELAGWPVEVGLLESLDPAIADNHLEGPAYDPVAGFFLPDVNASITSTPAVGNLDASADGSLEVVVAAHGGRVYAYDAAGQLLPGFPVETDPALAGPDGPNDLVHRSIAIASPALGDVDGDGDLEIVAPAFDSHVYMWHHDGSLDPGFPVLLSDATQGANTETTQIVSTPALGDLDLDGLLDIVVGSNEAYSGDTSGRVYAVHGDGNGHAGGPYHPGWPIPLVGGSVSVLPVVGRGVPQSPALADVNGDGVLEIAIHTTATSPDIYLADQSARAAAAIGLKLMRTENFEFGGLSTSVDRPSLGLINHPTFADFDNDGQVDLITGSAGFNFALSFASGGVRISYDHTLSAWDLSEGVSMGGVLEVPYFEAWPRLMEDFQFFMSPAVADLDDDGLPEVINGTGSYLVHAMDVSGEELPGWPKFTNGWVISSPTVGDIDGDGLREVVTSTRDGYLFAWNVPGSNAGTLEWESFHHDRWNSGNYENTLIPGGGPTDGGVGSEPIEEPKGCCSCRVGGDGEEPVRGRAGGPAVLVFALGLWVLRRRRRG